MVGLPRVELGTNGLWVHCSNQHELESHWVYTLYMHYTIVLIIQSTWKKVNQNPAKTWKFDQEFQGFSGDSWEFWAVLEQFFRLGTVRSGWGWEAIVEWCQPYLHNIPTILPQYSHHNPQSNLTPWSRYIEESLICCSGVLLYIVLFLDRCYSGVLLYIVYILCCHPALYIDHV